MVDAMLSSSAGSLSGKMDTVGLDTDTHMLIPQLLLQLQIWHYGRSVACTGDEAKQGRIHGGAAGGDARCKTKGASIICVGLIPVPLSNANLLCFSSGKGQVQHQERKDGLLSYYRSHC